MGCSLAHNFCCVSEGYVLRVHPIHHVSACTLLRSGMSCSCITVGVDTHNCRCICPRDGMSFFWSGNRLYGHHTSVSVGGCISDSDFLNALIDAGQLFRLFHSLYQGFKNRHFANACPSFLRFHTSLPSFPWTYDTSLPFLLSSVFSDRAYNSYLTSSSSDICSYFCNTCLTNNLQVKGTHQGWSSNLSLWHRSWMAFWVWSYLKCSFVVTVYHCYHEFLVDRFVALMSNLLCDIFWFVRYGFMAPSSGDGSCLPVCFYHHSYSPWNLYTVL